MIEGAVILLAGAAIGWFARRLAERQVRAIKPPKRNVCSCSHTLAMHDPKTKACHAEDYKKGNITANWREWRRCPCRHYDGPEPYPEFYAPELPQ